MDFRSTQPQVSHQAAPGAGAQGPKRDLKKNLPWNRVGAVGLLFVLTILVVAAIAFMSLTRVSSSDQAKYVNGAKYQAVFLTNGQVYFGNISAQGRDFIQLKNSYYLTQNTTTNTSGQAVTDGNYTLVKLGCQQIHNPLDEMVIQREQVSFWENLNDDGKVVKSIVDFKKQNPNGPNCSTVSNQTQATPNTGTQGTTTTTPTTTNTTTGR